MNWYVVYTKSRYEKIVAGRLADIGVEVYCPLLKIKRKWSDRWKWVEEPLFKSYCFVKLDDDDRERVFSIPGIVRFVYHCGRPAIVRPGELELLKNWLNDYSHDSFESSSFHARDKVYLRSGALMDQEAEVLGGSGRYLFLFLESLGFRIKVDMSKNIVEKLAAF